MHRIELYNSITSDPGFDWSKVDLLLPSAAHIGDRFIRKREGLSKPKEILIAPTNLINPEQFPFFERRWEPPYRIGLVGNFVPKKRQYSAIEMMYDVKAEFGDKFWLDIAGEKGMWSGYGNPEYYQNCLDLVDELGLKDVVRMYAKIPHEGMKDFYNREHIVLSNSNEEGTHVSIAEGISTGCTAFVHTWRGAKDVYPDTVARHFHSPMEFLGLCRSFLQCVKNQELPAASEKMAGLFRSTLGDWGKYGRLVEVIESKVEARKKARAVK